VGGLWLVDSLASVGLFAGFGWFFDWLCLAGCFWLVGFGSSGEY
jgi:hypothetical protein